jgi:hypothetical protein
VDGLIGTFDGLAEGDTVFINGIGFKRSYVGGTGNDVTQTQLMQVTVVASPAPKNEDAPGVRPHLHVHSRRHPGRDDGQVQRRFNGNVRDRLYSSGSQDIFCFCHRGNDHLRVRASHGSSYAAGASFVAAGEISDLPLSLPEGIEDAFAGGWTT